MCVCVCVCVCVKVIQFFLPQLLHLSLLSTSDRESLQAFVLMACRRCVYTYIECVLYRVLMACRRCVYTCTYILHICTHTNTSSHPRHYINVCVCVCVCVCIHTPLPTLNVGPRHCSNVCVCVCVCVCVFIHRCLLSTSDIESLQCQKRPSTVSKET